MKESRKSVRAAAQAGKPRESQGRGRRFERGDLARIGRFLRDQRLATGVSLQRLASLSGVSPGTIRAIEGGQSNPSLGTVLAIVDALGLSLDALSDAARGQVPRIAVVTRAADLTGDEIDLSRGLDAPVMAARLLSLPGKSLRPLPEADGTSPIMGMVVSGSLLAGTRTGERVRLDAGDSYHAQPGHVRGWANRGTRPVRLLHVADRSRQNGTGAT